LCYGVLLRESRNEFSLLTDAAKHCHVAACSSGPPVRYTQKPLKTDTSWFARRAHWLHGFVADAPQANPNCRGISTGSFAVNGFLD
jgi:hypothetical protein